MPPKDFISLDPALAQQFLRAFQARAEDRREDFRREVARRGGPPTSELDGSPASLVPLWQWFIAHAGEAGGTEPDWYKPDPPGTNGVLTPAQLHDLDGVVFYLADAFQGALPGLVWGLGKMPKRLRYVAQNKPVLKGDGYDVDVLSVAYNLAMRWRNGDQDPEALRRTFNAWVDPILAES